MIIFPAIDLKAGSCVRLEQGDMARVTLFNKDAGAQARDFHALGFSHLHVVDLDGAFQGAPVNVQAVEAILRATPAPVQLGGGIRDLASIEMWLDKGVSRIILGTLALRAPDMVAQACRLFPERILVGIDARCGRVAVQGWAEQSDIMASALAQQCEDVGVAGLIYTDIERDGLLGGLNIEATAALAESVSLPIIASGGLAGLDDVVALKEKEASGIMGAIAGRALYDGRLDAPSVLALEGVM